MEWAFCIVHGPFRVNKYPHDFRGHGTEADCDYAWIMGHWSSKEEVDKWRQENYQSLTNMELISC